jgi:transketolase
MQVIVPSDPESTRWATRYAAEHVGPVYLRLSRGEYPDLYPAGTTFQAGQGKIVRPGKDCTVFAIGILVHKALEAAELLQAEGIELEVVDLVSVKPIDRELIVASAKKTGAVVCAEEHQIYGGAGSAVAEVLAGQGVGAPTEFIGVQDVFTETGKYDGLLQTYGLDAKAVAEAAKRAIGRK